MLLRFCREEYCSTTASCCSTVALWSTVVCCEAYYYNTMPARYPMLGCYFQDSEVSEDVTLLEGESIVAYHG